MKMVLLMDSLKEWKLERWTDATMGSQMDKMMELM
jgi:hypothetical protein